MKRIVLSVAFVFLFCSQAIGQTKRVEPNIQIGLGGFSGTWDDPGVALQASLGLDIKLNDRFSLMPYAGTRLLSEGLLHIGADGADFDFFNLLELGVEGRYHFADGPVILGLAPYFSYMPDVDTYYIDWDPCHSLGGQPKVKASDFGLKPAFYYDLNKHFRLGLEAGLGFRNSLIQYPEYDRSGTWHVNSVIATLGFHF